MRLLDRLRFSQARSRCSRFEDKAVLDSLFSGHPCCVSCSTRGMVDRLLRQHGVNFHCVLRISCAVISGRLPAPLSCRQGGLVNQELSVWQRHAIRFVGAQQRDGRDRRGQPHTDNPHRRLDEPHRIHDRKAIIDEPPGEFCTTVMGRSLSSASRQELGYHFLGQLRVDGPKELQRSGLEQTGDKPAFSFILRPLCQPSCVPHVVHPINYGRFMGCDNTFSAITHRPVAGNARRGVETVFIVCRPSNECLVDNAAAHQYLPRPATAGRP